MSNDTAHGQCDNTSSSVITFVVSNTSSIKEDANHVRKLFLSTVNIFSDVVESGCIKIGSR